MLTRISTAGSPANDRFRAWSVRVSEIILAAGSVAIYRRTFAVPLLLDDISSIADNVSIRRLWPLWSVLSPPPEAGVGSRPLFNLSFALNYAAGGTSVFGYHLVNLVIHILASWALFAVVRRTLQRPVLAERFGSAATPLALAISAFWAWHPVQTESVTYLSQRAESLMGLFYLLTFYCFERAVEAEEKRSGRMWFSLCVAACLAGAGIKEIIVTAPVMIFLYDRTFVSGTFGAAWRRHWPVYLGLAATWLPLAYGLAGARRGVGFGQGVTWSAYGLAECRVVVKYLLLCVWPSPLIFDYGPRLANHLSEIWPYALVLGSLLAATFGAVRRAPAAGFLGCWFFLILAPASSVVPVVLQPMAENRLYLPLAAVAAFAVLGIYSLVGRRSLVAFALVALVLGLAAVQRNRAYASAPAIWQDTILKNPTNARAHNNLGFVWANQPGRLVDAIAQYREALRLDPDYAEAHNNLGSAWIGQPSRLDDAIAEYREALRVKPNYAEAHYNLGNVWQNQPGRLNDAIAEYQAAIRAKPNFAPAHYNLGNAWLSVPGHVNDAIAEYETTVRLQPDYADAHNNLGNAWFMVPGRLQDAIAQFEETLRLKPDYAEAHNNLGNAWARIPGRLPDAIAQYEEAVRLKPDFAQAHYDLACARASIPGQLRDAIAQYEEALRVRPDFPEAHNNLGNAWLNLTGHLGDAIAEYEEAVRLKPDFAQAHFNLAGALLKLPGHSDEAIAHLETVLRLQPENDTVRQILGRLRPASH